MLDRRLLGSWRSDNRRTMREFRNLKGFSEHVIRSLRKKIFGKLVHRWTRAKFCTAFSEGEDWTAVPYRVLASDEDSVAVRVTADPESALGEKDHILHVHFDGPDYYWIPLEMGPGMAREWFRRIAQPRSKKK